MAYNHILRTEREKHGWTYKDVADQIDLPDAPTVGRWERGKTSPGPRYKRELSRIFGKSIEELGLVKTSTFNNAGTAFNKIPTNFTTFVGRKQEITTVGALLKSPEVRLLSLVGTGGIGKTRLGVEAALQVRDQFIDGVCYVPLSELRNPASVLPAIIAALGIEDSGPLALLDLVKTFLHEKHVLLLLDNFEHVASAAPFLEELLQDCQRVKVLVTSRHVLQLEGEHTFFVPALSLPPDLTQSLKIEGITHYTAIALFLQRAQTHVPTFKITENNVHAIAELCAHLDGLPLAIELAAARIKLFSPQMLLTRLLQDQQILKSDLLTIPERHRTLYAMIKSSYDLLNEQEQWLLRHLAIFVGSMAIETIEAVFSPYISASLTIVEIVNSLLNKSLLQRIEHDDKEPRFFMLETIRHFAVSHLQQNGELGHLQHTYARYYLGLVEQASPYLKNTQQSAWLTKLEQEIGNLRATLQWLIEQQDTERALRFCEPFGKFCGLRGYWHEEQSWLQAVLQLPEGQQQGLRARVLRRAGHLAYRLRDLAGARALLEQSVVYSRQVEDWQNLPGALSTLGWVFYRQNEIDKGGQLLKECIDIAYRSGNNWVIANSLESLGRFEQYQGNIAEADTLLQKSIAIARHYLDKESLARILMTMARLQIAQGDIEQATQLVQESSSLADELGNTPLIALALDTSGEVALFRGDYTMARQLFEERIEMANDLGDASAIASKQLNIVDIELIEQNLQKAQHLLDKALVLLQQLNDPPDIALAYTILGDLKRIEGKLDQAQSLYLDVLRGYKASGDERKIGRCLMGLALMFFNQGMLDKAAYLLGASESRFKPYDMYPAQRTTFQHVTASVHERLGDADFAWAWSRGAAASLTQLLDDLSPNAESSQA